MLKLDCVRNDQGPGWMIVNTYSGGVLTRHENEDCGFAWMAAAHKLSEFVNETQREIANLTESRLRECRGMPDEEPSPYITGDVT